MTKNTFMKVFAAVALAVLVTPVAASAHGLGVNVQSGLHIKAAADDNRGQNHDNNKGNGNNSDKANKADKNDEVLKSATTSASMLTRASARLQGFADLLASMSNTIAAKITGANLSASTSAEANAKLADYNSSVANAKTKAGAAATVAASISASNSSTTNASLVAESRTDLSGARDFLKAAKKDLMSILNLLWVF